jgi:beta-glucosidase
MHKTLLAVAFLTAPLFAASPASAPPPSVTASAVPAAQSIYQAPEVMKRVDALLAQMTLDEKIGQLTQIGPEKGEDLIRSGKAGSVLWTIDSELIQKLQHIAVDESRLKIPLLIGYDVIHGFRNVFPVPLAMAASWDPALVERGQAIAAHEARVAGVNWSFGPMVDIARDARWGRMVEGAGEDPYLGAAIAAAQVRGFQGERLGSPDHVLSSVKHFAGYGAAEGGRDYDSVYIPDVAFQNVYLRPFKAAIDAGVGNVMSAYMALNDVPASGNRWLLQDILRGELGFRGFVISDAFGVASLVNHGLARDPEDAAFRGIMAGENMDMASKTYLNHLGALVASGKVPLAQIDEMVRQVLAVKIQLGLFEHPYGDLANKEKVLNDPASRQATREAAQETLVLLRNEQNFLPLSPHLKSVAIIGPLADAKKDTNGSWTAENPPAVTVVDGIRTKLPEAKIEYVQGADMQRLYPYPWEAMDGKKAPAMMTTDELKAEAAKAVAAAERADAVILVLGERANMAGEAASYASLALHGNQQALLEAVVATGKPVVLVLLTGRPLDITWAAEHVPAILEAWFPGEEGGNAIAAALFGDVNPSGKLPVTWPRSTGQEPAYYNHNRTHAVEDDPTFTSRFIDSVTAPLYPFGYGLSYTTFAFSNLSLDRTTVGADGTVTVSAVIQNTGSRAGDDIAQLYIHQRAGAIVRPVRELKGFQRVTLAPGEKKTIQFTLSRAELEYWSPLTRTWTIDPEMFEVWVGDDSRATLHGEFRVGR